MDISIEVEMPYGRKGWHVDDVLAILIDSEGVFEPIAIVENEEDVREVGFTTAEEARKVNLYHKGRVLEYNSFRESVRALRHKNNKLIEWLEAPSSNPPPPPFALERFFKEWRYRP